MANQELGAAQRFVRLSQRGVPAGEPDIRGWLLVGAEGRRAGRVTDVLLDPDGDQPRFIEVTLDRGVAIAADTPSVVVPIECLRADPVRPHVHLLRVAARELVHIPASGQPPVDESAESLLRRFFRCTKQVHAVEEFWHHRRQRRSSRIHAYKQVQCVW
jgi:hypothetical protein